MGRHSAQPTRNPYDRRPLAVAAIAVVSSALAVIGVVSVANATPPTDLAIHCGPNVPIIVYPNGTWECQTETTGPTPTPTLSESPAPTGSPSPSTSPSPTAVPTTASPTPTASPTSSPSPTASPTPSPSPTIGPVLLTNCFTRLAQCGYPHPGNTGVPAGMNLTPYAGPMSITTANTVIDGKSIGCGLTIRTSNVVIRNSRITGPCFYGVEVPSGNVTIQDSEIDCVNHKGTGVAFRNFVVLRSEIRNCENGAHTGSNVRIEDSYITGVVEVDGGHGDGLQGSSGSNITIRHNTFDLRNPITSSIIWDGLSISDLLVENNFFAAGAYTVYCPDSGANRVYRGNRFYGPVGNWQQDTHRPAFGFKTNCGGVTWTGNYRDDTLGVVS